MLPAFVFPLGHLRHACFRAFDEHGVEQIAVPAQGQSVKREA
jgi:hypothetical protein